MLRLLGVNDGCPRPLVAATVQSAPGRKKSHRLCRCCVNDTRESRPSAWPQPQGHEIGKRACRFKERGQQLGGQVRRVQPHDSTAGIDGKVVPVRVSQSITPPRVAVIEAEVGLRELRLRRRGGVQHQRPPSLDLRAQRLRRVPVVAWRPTVIVSYVQQVVPRGLLLPKRRAERGRSWLHDWDVRHLQRTVKSVLRLPCPDTPIRTRQPDVKGRKEAREPANCAR